MKMRYWGTIEEALIYYRSNPQKINATKKAKKIDTLHQQLLTDPFKTNVIHECETIFYHRHSKFQKELNIRNLLPFNNGVIDLDKLQFRDGLPEDNMSLTTRIDYIAYDITNATVLEIEKWFEQVQPDQEQRLYLQKLYGYFLTNDTSLQHVWIWTGAGQNAKSFFIVKILKPAFGNFFVSAATQLLTRKRGKR